MRCGVSRCVVQCRAALWGVVMCTVPRQNISPKRSSTRGLKADMPKNNSKKEVSSFGFSFTMVKSKRCDYFLICVAPPHPHTAPTLTCVPVWKVHPSSRRLSWCSVSAECRRCGRVCELTLAELITVCRIDALAIVILWFKNWEVYHGKIARGKAAERSNCHFLFCCVEVFFGLKVFNGVIWITYFALTALTIYSRSNAVFERKCVARV